jgi:glycosyltransferase involved in cell wall biosynthesis
MKLHLVGLPWTATTDEYLTCAYTQKVVKFCRMYEGDKNVQIYLYGSELNDAPCDEHIVLMREAERHAFFGEWGTEALFEKVTWDRSQQPWRLWNQRAAAELIQRAKGDIVLLSNGNPFLPLEAGVRAFHENDVVICEPFVGYEGIFTGYCAFESHAWRNHVYGLNGWRQGRWYDTTIPNFFDKRDFPYLNSGDGDFLLYVGRVIERKGVREAVELAKACKMKLVIAGPGVKDSGPGFIEGDDIRLEYKGLVYAGTVNPDERAQLMAAAKALVCPTLYVEPFGGVAVEAMMCGTPVLSTDWGAFVETIEHGKTGFRFNTLQEGVDAVDKLSSLKPASIARCANRKYELKAVKPQFDRWFGQLRGLWGLGWGELAPRDRNADVVDGDAQRRRP